MKSIIKILSYLLVGGLWGITNPFLKQGTQINTSSISSTSSTINSTNEFKEISFFKRYYDLLIYFVKPAVFLPIIINQLGSVAFYYLLATDDISIAVPLCNSLTFAFTGITGWFLGERIQQPIFFLIGILFILCGIYLCVIS